MKTCFLISTFLIAFFILISNCGRKVKKIEQAGEVSFFDPLVLGSANPQNNLLIETRFRECGEWGGHKETIIVSADKENVFSATYKVYPFNCDSISYYNKSGNITATMEKKIILNDQKKQCIIDYIHRMVQSKITEKALGSNGDKSFSVVTSDSSLFISVSERKNHETESYKTLVDELLK